MTYEKKPGSVRLPSSMRSVSLAFFASCLACGVFVHGCSNKRPIPAIPPADTSVTKPITLKRAQYLMGTVVEITAVAPTESTAQTALDAGFKEIQRLEQ